MKLKGVKGSYRFAKELEDVCLTCKPSSLIVHPSSEFPSLSCPELCRRREGIGVGSLFIPPPNGLSISPDLYTRLQKVSLRRQRL